MTWYITVMGVIAFRLGLVTTTDAAGAREIFSPNMAGCGAAAFLGVMAAQVIA